jgi:hypothetical protein
MSLVNINIPNLLNGVSQQADSLRFATQGKEQINGFSSVSKGLTKRNSSDYLFNLGLLSIQDRNPIIHFINRDKKERYVVAIFGQKDNPDMNVTEGDAGIMRIWDINTGSELQVYHNPDGNALIGEPVLGYGTSAGKQAFDTQEDYSNRVDNLDGIDRSMAFLSRNPKENLKIFTIADTSFILNKKKVVETIPSSRPPSLENTTVTRVGTVATVNLVGGVSNSLVEIGETIQVLGTTALSGPNIITGKPTGTSFTFDTLDIGPTTYTNNISFELGEKLVPYTMPHVLKRESDGSFFLQRVYYNARGVGNSTSNPNPSFVGKRINDIFFFRSRLGFLCDENVILSENSSFFNFYRTDLTTLLDSDPIDVSTSHSKVTILNHAVPFSERLLLFSDEAQFYMTSVDILTPKTASIQQATEFNTEKTCSPSIVGKNVFFSYQNGEYSGIMEYFLTKDTLELDATDLTSGIPTYIQDKITKIVSSNNDQIVFFLTEGEKNKSVIYVYKYFLTEDQKLQSSWSKWEFEENEKILSIEVIDEYLYLVKDRADFDFTYYPNGNQKGGMWLERIQVKDVFDRVELDSFIKLDKKITNEQLISSSYDSQTDETTFVLPYNTEKSIQIISNKRSDNNFRYDTSPDNDDLFLDNLFSDGTSYTLLNQGTSTEVHNFFLFNVLDPVPETVDISSFSDSRNKYKYTDGNNGVTIDCQIVSYGNPFGVDPTTVHWLILKKSQTPTSQSLDYYLSSPYPDPSVMNDFDYDTQAFDNNDIKLPDSLPKYPWQVKAWTKFVPEPEDYFNSQADKAVFDFINSPLDFTVAEKIKRKPIEMISNNFELFSKVIVKNQTKTLVNFPTRQEKSSIPTEKVMIKVNGDYSQSPLIFGIPYEFRYEFSKPILRLVSGGGQRTAVSDGRFQIKTGNLSFNDCVAFNVEVTAPFRNKNVYKFSNYTVGRGDLLIGDFPVKSGAFRFPVLSRNDSELKVEIVNDTPYPSSFISMDWEAFYSARARRI